METEELVPISCSHLRLSCDLAHLYVQLIWFLNGGVLLCRQQHERVKEAIPYAVTKCVVGEDGPELWGSSETWREVLNGVDIMFSTFAVLRDALAHAWLKITDLGLLIFDEGKLKAAPNDKPHQSLY